MVAVKTQESPKKYMERLESSEKLAKLIEYSKRKYEKADLEQHNWSHIVRDIYRAEKISKTENDVEMNLLYPSIILHDIGVTVGEYENHDENSRKIAREKLPEFGYSYEETEKVIQILEEFSGEKEVKMVEAKILSDADKLEKSSLASISNLFKVHMEWNKGLEEMVEDFSRYKKWRDEGFYTDKARDINQNGIQERIDFLEKFKQKLEERKDFTATEKDLKLNL